MTVCRDLSAVTLLGLGLVAQNLKFSIWSLMAWYSTVAVPVVIFSFLYGQKKR